MRPSRVAALIAVGASAALIVAGVLGMYSGKNVDVLHFCTAWGPACSLELWARAFAFRLHTPSGYIAIVGGVVAIVAAVLAWRSRRGSGRA